MLNMKLKSLLFDARIRELWQNRPESVSIRERIIHQGYYVLSFILFPRIYFHITLDISL